MRPRGELFLAVQEALKRVRKATKRAIYHWLTRLGVQATQRAVSKTVENMAMLGHVVPVGLVQVPWSRRPVCRYALSQAAVPRESVLLSVMAGWGRAS